MEEAELLDAAVGLKLPRLQSIALQVKNFHSSRTVWRNQYYFDPAYRRALTNTARAIPVHTSVCLQVGSMFALPAVFPDRRCFAYQDGNLHEKIRSGFGLSGVPARRIDEALRYEEELAHRLDGIFTFSDYLRNSYIHDFGVDAHKVHTIGGAVNLAEIPGVDPEKDYTLQKLLFIGVDVERKGCKILLQAFRTIRQLYPRAELHIVGPSRLDDLPEGVVFHGRLSKRDPHQKQELDELFAQSTLFILPSLYEPFGIAPLEAMIHQIPCVLTDAWALREFVTPGVNGELVEKGSVEDLILKITEMLADPDRLAVMGRRSRKMVLERYTWDAVVSRMSEALCPRYVEQSTAEFSTEAAEYIQNR